MPDRIRITEDERENGLTGAWHCDRCGTRVERYRGEGDVDCHHCGAHYNSFGQRLRDDLHTRVNMSEYDEDITDMDGYEAMYAGDE
jgi:hypothetical protein